jgi:hypothetical protein
MNILAKLKRLETSNYLTQYEIIALGEAQWNIYVTGFGYKPVCCRFA